MYGVNICHTVHKLCLSVVRIVLMLYINTPYIFVFDIVVPDQCRSMVCVSATSPRCLSVTKVNLSSRCGTSPRKRSRPRLMSPHWSGKYQRQDSTCIIQGNSVYQFYLIIVVHSFCLSCYFMFLCLVVSVEHTFSYLQEENLLLGSSI